MEKIINESITMDTDGDVIIDTDEGIKKVKKVPEKEKTSKELKKEKRKLEKAYLKGNYAQCCECGRPAASAFMTKKEKAQIRFVTFYKYSRGYICDLCKNKKEEI